MKLCPDATYRRLVVLPHAVTFALWDDSRELHFLSDEKADWNSFVDFEGVRRLRSRFALFQQRDAVARAGIRQPQAREAFVRTSKERGSLVCAVRIQIPRGSCCTTALRDVFRLGTIPPKTIVSLLR